MSISPKENPKIGVNKIIAVNVHLQDKIGFSGRGKSVEAWQTECTCLWTLIIFHCYELSETTSAGGRIAPIESEPGDSEVSSSLGDRTVAEGKPSIFRNQDLLEHNHVHLFIHCLLC